MRQAPTKSPYLTHQNLLGDVLAAIQCLGTYKFYKLDFASRAERISGDAGKSDHWKSVFEQHPEFFRIDTTGENVSLVWRRQYPKRFHVDQERLLTKAEIDTLSVAERQRVSRTALTADDVQTLLRTAIDLHTRAADHERERRWWLPLATAAAALIGSLAGAAFRG